VTLGKEIKLTDLNARPEAILLLTSGWGWLMEKGVI
jgi:hypothetical protein